MLRQVHVSKNVDLDGVGINQVLTNKTSKIWWTFELRYGRFVVCIWLQVIPHFNQVYHKIPITKSAKRFEKGKIFLQTRNTHD